MSVLTRHEIIMELRRGLGLPARRAAKALHVVVKTMRAALESGDSVNLRGLGELQILCTPARRYRHRPTGKMVTRRAKRTGAFVPWKELL